MQLLSLLHRWTGGLTGLVLAVIGLSGAVLVWKDAWIALPGAHEPYRSDTAMLAHVVEVAASSGQQLSRITFGNDQMSLHQAIYSDGGGAYFTQGGQLVERWDSLWHRPELWLFDLHHYLFLGDAGKYVTGVAGLLLLAFAVTGTILWWQTRRTFRFRLWPVRMSRSAIVRHHRDIGMIASPLLLLAAITGSLMIFKPLADLILLPWSQENVAAKGVPAAGLVPTATPDWRKVMLSAQAAFPVASARRLQLPANPGEPVLVRFRQDFEWTPNGRSYVYLDPATDQILATENPATGDPAQRIEEKFYPLHAGKVGGLLWKLCLTFAGGALTLLGTLASWSFWFRSNDNRKGTKLGPRVSLHA